LKFGVKNYSLMKPTFRIFRFLGAMACASAAIPAYAVLPTVITSVPFNITAPGKYVLNTNLTLAPNSIRAILITCSDVTVDLNGYTLTGYGDTSYKGFAIQAYGATGALSNITVKNGTLTSFREGILSASGNALVGSGMKDSVFRNITMSAIDIPIYEVGGTDNRFEDCTIIQSANTTIGIYLLNCTDDVVSGNYFKLLPTSSTYQNILIQGTVEGNDVVNNKDVTP
jgi:hypothetical protein